MFEYKRILVATDGSEFSDEALRQAVSLAKKNNARLTAVSVAYTARPWVLKDAIRQEAEKALLRAKELAEQEGVVLRTRIEEGYPFEKIIEVAKELKSDLIVMGSHGHTGIGKILIGSVTERVIGGAPCPVLVAQKKE
nr:universal stress protein [Desulfobacterales bacterium]